MIIRCPAYPHTAYIHTITLPRWDPTQPASSPRLLILPQPSQRFLSRRRRLGEAHQPDLSRSSDSRDHMPLEELRSPERPCRCMRARSADRTCGVRGERGVGGVGHAAFLGGGARRETPGQADAAAALRSARVRTPSSDPASRLASLRACGARGSRARLRHPGALRVLSRDAAQVAWLASPWSRGDAGESLSQQPGESASRPGSRGQAALFACRASQPNPSAPWPRDRPESGTPRTLSAQGVLVFLSRRCRSAVAVLAVRTQRRRLARLLSRSPHLLFTRPRPARSREPAALASGSPKFGHIQTQTQRKNLRMIARFPIGLRSYQSLPGRLSKSRAPGSEPTRPSSGQKPIIAGNNY